MDETPKSKFLVHLQQHEWITTETFEFEADTKEEAEKLAKQHVKDEKDLKVDYRLTTEEVKLPEPPAEQPGIAPVDPTADIPEAEVV